MEIATRDEVHVHETIIRLDGSQTIVEVMATFGGGEYPVIGSPAADTIACRCVSSNSFHSGAHVAASGIAVFERDTETIL